MCFTYVLGYVCVCECSFALCIYFKYAMWKSSFFCVQTGSTSIGKGAKTSAKLEVSTSRKDLVGELGRCYLRVHTCNQWSHLDLVFPLCKVFITSSISLLIIGLFRFSVLFWVSIGNLHLSRNLFILSSYLIHFSRSYFHYYQWRFLFKL